MRINPALFKALIVDESYENQTREKLNINLFAASGFRVGDHYML